MTESNQDPKSRTKATLTGKRCQCPACGEYFSTDSNFDKHRKGDHATGRFCADPEAIGLVLKTSGDNTMWAMPGNGFVRASTTKGLTA